SFRWHSLANSLRRHGFFDPLYGNRFANLLMRLKIEILGSLLGDPGKDRSRNESAVIQLRFARVRIVEHHKTDKLGTLYRQIADERNTVLSLFISASGINLLRGSGFAGNCKTWDGSGGRRAAIAHDATQRVTNFPGCLRGNHLTQHDRGRRADGFALRS